ncbi:NaeI family type II restriction endonuclease [Actinosynnema sp. NPDC053489]|uniref:NaeI family type II restriction endonuclease n=1 Tax=Actinosynnema sp. NPDC053489 TaxID=3363916 RepID=UPI0037CBDCD4
MSSGPNSGTDGELTEIARWFSGQRNAWERLGTVVRNSLDEVLDGQRTGRFDVADLDEVERAYLGTKFAILVGAGFGLRRGTRARFAIAGHDVEPAFSSGSAWSIPSGAAGRPCFVVSVDDRRSTFDAGLVRATRDVLKRSSGGRREVLPTASAKIAWLAREAHLPENALLHLPRLVSSAIMSRESGQRRVNELFRRVQGELVDRTTVATVATQADAMKRCRDARRLLAPEGIVVLGHQKDGPRVAEALKLPVPHKGSHLAVRLVRVSPSSTGRPTAEIGNAHYAVARPGDPVAPAPVIDC